MWNKNLLFALVFIFALPALQAQQTAAPAKLSALERAEQTQKISGLLLQFANNILPASFNPDFVKGLPVWSKPLENSKEIALVRISLIALDKALNKSALSSSYTERQEKWRAKLAKARTGKEIALLLSQLQAGLKATAYKESWPAAKAKWQDAIGALQQ